MHCLAIITFGFNPLHSVMITANLSGAFLHSYVRPFNAMIYHRLDNAANNNLSALQFSTNDGSTHNNSMENII